LDAEVQENAFMLERNGVVGPIERRSFEIFQTRLMIGYATNQAMTARRPGRAENLYRGKHDCGFPHIHPIDISTTPKSRSLYNCD